MRLVLRKKWVSGGRVAATASALALAWLACQPAAAAAVDRAEAGAQTATSQPADPQRIPVPSGAGADRDRRLAQKGMAAGSPVMIRIFKAESELELWMRREERFELFATYPICYWSGTLGPKLHEGDKQAPEGLYAIGMRQLHRRGRWPRSLDLGFPNALDRAHARTGSYILVHGGCTSTGCYAMTNPVIDEIFGLSEQALRRGQERIPVHVFPFRMTQANLAAHADSAWHGFWLGLKDAYDIFERTRVPPRIDVCNKRYVVSEAGPLGGPTAAPDVDGQEDEACAESEEDGRIPIPGADAGGASIKAVRAASKARSGHRVRRNSRKAYAATRRVR